MDALAEARSRLLRFAEVEADPGGAPGYAALARMAAADDDLAGLLALAPEKQRRATLFFAAVHHLARKSVGWDAVSEGAAFRRFCLQHAGEMRALISTRSTQTNEVGRALGLAPTVAGLPQPVALIEVGASAGLNLHLDRIARGAVRLAGEVRGAPPRSGAPTIAWRVGIDPHPVDVHDDDAVDWLRACVWAEHTARLTLLDDAIALAREHPVEIRAGDAAALLPAAIGDAPADATVCVMHSAVVPYLTREQWSAIVEAMRTASQGRDLWWVPCEGWTLAGAIGLEVPPRAPDEDLSFLIGRALWRGGGLHQRATIASMQPHGAWVRWL